MEGEGGGEGGGGIDKVKGETLDSIDVLGYVIGNRSYWGWDWEMNVNG